jgi:hypothetical protein
MAATVEIDEVNGADPGSRMHGITNSNYGSIDNVNMNAANNPIIPGDNSYQKWQQWHVVDMGGSAIVKDLKFFADAGPSADTTHLFNGHTDQGQYDASRKTAYETPATATDDCPNAVPTAAPGSANIGIGGALAGEITANDSLSDFVVHMIGTTVNAVAGKSLTLTYRYNEVA